MAFDSNSHLYVVDGGNHRVQRFDISGKQILQFGSKGAGDGELNGPFGIAIHMDKAYIADFYNKRMQCSKLKVAFATLLVVNVWPVLRMSPSVLVTKCLLLILAVTKFTLFHWMVSLSVNLANKESVKVN